MPELNPSLAGQRPNPMFRIGALVHGRADVLHLEFGEPDFPTPAYITTAAIESLRNERQGYGPGPGLPELRAAVAQRVARVSGFAPGPERVVLTAGGTGALMASLQALCAPGDEVLTPDPGWPGYDAMLAAAGVRRVYYPLVAEGGWQPDLAALEAAITPRAKLLLINSPSNPGGAVYAPETMRALVEIAQRHDLWVLSDECYDELIYTGTHTSAGAFDADGRVVVVGTFSKTYAMTGWRIGWAATTPAVRPEGAAAIGLVSTAQINNLPLFVQRAAQAALAGPQTAVAEMRAAYERRRDLAVDLLRAAGLLEYVPAGAFYLLVPVARAARWPETARFDSISFAGRLLTERGIAVAPGGAFGARTSRYARLSLASSPPVLREGLDGLVDFAAGYRAG